MGALPPYPCPRDQSLGNPINALRFELKWEKILRDGDAVPLCFILWLLRCCGSSQPFQREYSANNEQDH